MPDWAPKNWGRSAGDAYHQYIAEREADIKAGIKPSTDQIQPWMEFFLEYLTAELEAAD